MNKHVVVRFSCLSSATRSRCVVESTTRLAAAKPPFPSPSLGKGVDSDFENLVKTSRKFLRRDGMLKRRGREGLRRGRRANSARLASASSARTSAPFALEQHGPKNFKSLWLGF